MLMIKMSVLASTDKCLQYFSDGSFVALVKPGSTSPAPGGPVWPVSDLLPVSHQSLSVSWMFPTSQKYKVNYASVP